MVVPRRLLAQDVRVLRFGLPRTPRQVVPDVKRGLASVRGLEQFARVPRRITSGSNVTYRPIRAVRAGTSADGTRSTLTPDSGRG